MPSHMQQFFCLIYPLLLIRLTIISKLSAEFVFSDIALERFSTYLNNSSNFVQGAGYASHTVDVKPGVPQGSILGPGLFSLCFKSV